MMVLMDQLTYGENSRLDRTRYQIGNKPNLDVEHD
jgi:hypothetical protein